MTQKILDSKNKSENDIEYTALGFRFLVIYSLFYVFMSGIHSARSFTRFSKQKRDYIKMFGNTITYVPDCNNRDMHYKPN